ncbi:murein biosynthesis integral membrane protein MurJ [Clostridium swellfunianum]|uniref:murein biosynthesis integral membrane protein MurJ n=1 Tax=Clostridium swellfunianum TaxID=1367462 RepID=UPI002030D5A4|nr:murein biosynthesis integral membrane protein MurJ [Clostridium swellfunianum]MCM0647439.1 murein biosynthesis integral membrane protein MurJ [Clostridium swellfunianum]
MSTRKLAKVAGLLMIITVLSKAVGFMRESLIASAFGATYKTDAYNVAIIVPSMVYGLFGGAISTTFIPILNESLAKKGKEDSLEYANSVMNILFIFSFILFIIGGIFSSELVSFIAPKFTEETHKLAVVLTQISVVNIVFITLNSGFEAILQSLGEFVVPSLSGFITSLPIIIYIMLGANFGIEGLIIIFVFGTFMQVLIQIPWLLKNKYKFRLKVNFRDNRLKTMLLLLGPVLLGSGVSQINTLVDRNMASGLPEGSIAALGFANVISNMLYSIFITTIVTVIYPTMSKESGVENREKFKYLILKAINTISIIIVPATIGVMILRIPIINILFKRGAFDIRAVNMTSEALLYLCIGLLFIGIRDILSKAFYAIQDTKTPMFNAIIGIVINIIANLILVKSMGIGGLALGTSLSSIVCTLLLGKDIVKKIGNMNTSILLKTESKIFAATSIMGICIYAVNYFLSSIRTNVKGEIISLGITVASGVLIYSAMIMILKVEEFADLMSILKKKIKK